MPFKGFIYGLVVGLISNPDSLELKLKQLLQQIINVHAEEKNKLLNKKYDAQKFIKGFRDSVSSTQRLKQLIDEAEKIFSTIFPLKQIPEDKMHNAFFELYKSKLNSIEDAKRFVEYVKLSDEIFEINNFSKLLKVLNKSSDNPPSFLFDTIRESTKKSRC